MGFYGFSFNGIELSHWDSHIVENNTVDDKPIIYWINVTDRIIPPNIDKIFLINCSKIVIENQHFNKSSSKIKLVYSNNITIRNNTFDYLLYPGLELINSDFNNIDNNKISNTYYGVFLKDGSNSNKISNNTFIGMSYGVRLQSSNFNLIQNNNFYDSYNPITLYESNRNKIVSNLCLNNTKGIFLRNSNSNIIDNNICRFNRQECIHNENSQSNTIVNNICTNNYYGIFLDKETNTTISNNLCSFNNGDGLALICNSSLITNNVCISNNQSGIGLNGFNNEIINNTSTSNKDSGIYIRGSGNLVGYNNFSNNDWGLNLDDFANKNIIFNNTISYNDRYGIVTQVDTINNLIYHNKVISNFRQIDIYDYYNTWNNSALEGNFWSDYTGVDNGANGRPKGDGIGDTKLPHHGVDYYPFVNPGAVSDDTGSGDGDSNFQIGIPFCRTLSIILIILLIVIFLLLRKILKRKKPRK